MAEKQELPDDRPPHVGRYWHPYCWKCGQPKNTDTSHCRSRFCPWCVRCCPPS